MSNSTIDLESPVHGWFGLSYSSYLVLRRSLMEGMPHEWQTRMVALLDELYDAYDVDQIPDRFTVKLRDRDGRFITDPYNDYRRPPPLPYRLEGRINE